MQLILAYSPHSVRNAQVFRSLQLLQLGSFATLSAKSFHPQKRQSLRSHSEQRFTSTPKVGVLQVDSFRLSLRARHAARIFSNSFFTLCLLHYLQPQRFDGRGLSFVFIA